MKYCNKCGNEVKDNVKFCPKCGSSINSNKDYNNIDTNSPKSDKKKRNNKLVMVLVCGILVVLFSLTAGITYMKMNSANKENKTKSVDVLSINIDKYPEITVSIKINNYEKKLDVKNITIKENDAFQKDLQLSDGENSNEYKITYKTSDESTSGERKMKIACSLDDNEVIAEYSYTAPEKKQGGNTKSNSNNSVNTYDNNEIKVKNALEDYEKSYIRMINLKNIDYIKNSIDLSGNLISDFTTLIKSYSEQEITEDLMSHNIEEIKKISDSEYEVTVTEKYYISYGKERKFSYTDFKDTYVVRLTSSGFKVYSIKNVTQISSKAN